MKQKKKEEKNGRPQEVYNHIITVTFFSSQIKQYLSGKEKKKKNPEETARLLADKGAQAGTAKLVLDIINTQKNDAH